SAASDVYKRQMGAQLSHDDGQQARCRRPDTASLMRCRSCGSTILNTMQQVFGAIGTSIATCLLSMGSGATDAEGFVAGSRYGYVFGLVLIVIVLVFSFFLKEDKISEK
ncbi:hypothetical protein PMN43_08435, partial [Bifidobacterium pseudocatenulatum]|nr:hypothetical protein [Bifidobacterium pseudocatenulatum]